MKKIDIWSRANIFLIMLIVGMMPVTAFSQQETYVTGAGQRIFRPQKQAWSFGRIFGTYDKAQLQRGLKVYTQVCAACHTLRFVHFQDLGNLGYDDDQLRIFAGKFEIEDGESNDGKPKMRPARLSDSFPPPFLNEAQARAANQGALPPDLSLIVRGRDFSPSPAWQRLLHYDTHVGEDYLYALLTGYRAPPIGEHVPQGKFYNPWFLSGNAISMPPPLHDGIIKYDDGVPETVDQYARDVTAFLSWTADPHRIERKKIGLRVMIFLVVFAIVLYLVKRRVWTD